MREVLNQFVVQLLAVLLAFSPVDLAQAKANGERHFPSAANRFVESRPERVASFKNETERTPSIAPSNGRILRVPAARATRRRPQDSAPIPNVQLPGQSRTLLPDGHWLLLGGEGDHGTTASAALFDPTTSAITKLPNGMSQARTWHTATVLPDGLVLILGGIADDGKVEPKAEVFDPSSLKFQQLNGTGLTPRAHHTTTLLTDGRLLIAGGVSAGGDTLDSVEFFSFKTKAKSGGDEALRLPTKSHTATLNPDGTVLLWGGSDKFGQPLSYGEAFDPVTNQFRVETAPFQNPADAESLSIKVSVPSDRDEDVPVDSYVALRFSHGIAVASANSVTLLLSGPDGTVPTKVVPAEGGMLAFVMPAIALAANTKYTLSLSGIQDARGAILSDTYISFTTAGKKDTTNAGGIVASGVGGNGGTDSAQKLPPLKAPAGVTALAGQALTLDGGPLQNVTFRIEDTSISTKTDGTGRFLLKNMTAGHHQLIIDGRSARGSKDTYGVFEVGVEIANGKTNVLDYTVWMTPLDEAHAVKVPFPTTSEVVVTNSMLPGLEFHIPANTTITDIDGNVASEISITPISIAQPPFPLPTGVKVPIYFTIQPGGGYISVGGGTRTKGARLIYPNTYKASPGARYNFWNYDPDEKGWYVYGQGTVSPDQNSIVPDTGVEIYELTGAMVADPGKAPGVGPNVSCQKFGLFCRYGEPVDLGTGLFVYEKTDLALADIIPLVLTRTYRQSDATSRAFGNGTTHNYDIFLVGDAYTYQELVLADGGRIRFDRISTGTSYGDAVYQNNSSPGPFFGAKIDWNGAGWNLTTKIGTRLVFPDSNGAASAQKAALLSITDRYGNKVTLTRDSNGNLTRILSPGGRYIEFSYDPSNRITQATDNINRTVQYFYNNSGYLDHIIDVNQGTWTYNYDTSNRMSGITDARNIQYLQNLYDGNGRVYRQIQVDGGIFQFNYSTDTNGNVTATDVIDPRGNVQHVVFAPAPISPSGYATGGIVSSGTGAQGTTIEASASFQAAPGVNFTTSTTDALGRTTNYEYDSLGNVTSITRLAGTPNAVTTSLTYDTTYSNVTSVTDPLGHTTKFSYDSRGNLMSTVDPLGNTSTFTHNSAGQILTATDSNGSTTQFSYSGGDLVSVVDPLARSVSEDYDGAGRLLSLKDTSGQTTRYEYNTLNQVTKVTDALGGMTVLSYDANGNLISLTDTRNTSTPTIYTYDNMDHLLTRKDPLGNTECYGTFSGASCQTNGYDGLGNLLQFTDRRGKVTTFNYDSLNRLSFVGYGTQPGPTYESTVNYTYDAGNRLTQAVDSLSGTITRSFNGLDRLTSETNPWGSIGSTYDLAGRRQTMTVAGQPAINYTFDSGDRLTQISQGSATVQFSYDAVSRRATLTLPNGIVGSYVYDNASQLTGLTYSLGGNAIGNLVYAYDQNGRRVSLGGSFARTGIPNPISTTAYNANNQLTTWGTANLFYDANGNVTSDGTHGYTWDARNQLKQIDSGITASFTYDPFGRRISKTILGASTNFLYDGLNPVQELSGTTPAANLLTGSLDEYFARTDSAGARNFLTDALGSTLALADSVGILQTSYTFEPFGSTTAGGAGTANSLAFTGRELDTMGLYFNRGRYYDPMIGRFISEDPIGFGGGSVNLSSYAGNNPVSGTDPTGLTIHLSNGSPQQIRDYDKAIDYLRQDSGMAGIISDLQASSTVYNVRFNIWDDDSFNPLTNTINWDPGSGCETSTGAGTQSAALGLGHEMAHAQHDFFGGLLAIITILAGRYDNWEELRVIGGPERTAAKTLGEPTRPDHRCTSTPHNPSPTMHTPINYPPPPPYMPPPHEMVH